MERLRHKMRGTQSQGPLRSLLGYDAGKNDDFRGVAPLPQLFQYSETANIGQHRIHQ